MAVISLAERFLFDGLPVRVLFGSGTVAETGVELERLGCERAVVLSTPAQQDEAEALRSQIGSRAVGVLAEATMHTPVDVTERAVAAVRALDADGLVAIGGGSTTGLGKAIVLRTGLPQLVLPTTYAGSEMTPILGQTEGGHKVTLTDRRVLPSTVIYDVDFTLGLPPRLTATSGLNAVAHAVEALYARERNPVISLLSVDSIAAFGEALPRLAEMPADPAARRRALYGAWLAGMALGSVGMALHHKICHTLGGAFNLDHADTHAVMLPHTAAFNEQEVSELLAPAATALDAASVGAGLYALSGQIGAPRSLAALGLQESDLDRAADLAVERPYWNPRPVTRDAIRDLLGRAWEGSPPGV